MSDVAGRPLRVLFLTQYFPPETGAPQARIFEMARILAARGHRIEVLTALPSYPQGRVYDGYRGRVWMREDMEGVRVARVPIYPARRPKTLLRLANYFSFVLSSGLLGPFLVSRPDVVVVESPPLFLGLSGILLKALLRCRMIFNVSDLFPESAVRMGMFSEGPLVTAARWLELLCYRNADAKTAQSPGIVDGIRSRDPRGRIALIPNGCDCDAFRPELRDHEWLEANGLDGKVIVGYAGLLGLPQGVGIILEAAEALRGDDRIAFVIVGDGAERERLLAHAHERGLKNVVFTGVLPKHRMPGLVSTFDMTIIPLRYFIPGALPSKIYEALASGVPVVLPAKGDAERLIEAADAGIVVDYDRVDTVVAAVRRLLDDPDERRRLGGNGRRYVLAHHSRRDIAARFEDLLRAVVAPPDTLETSPRR